MEYDENEKKNLKKYQNKKKTNQKKYYHNWIFFSIIFLIKIIPFLLYSWIKNQVIS
jgi:hypothetical protein